MLRASCTNLRTTDTRIPFLWSTVEWPTQTPHHHRARYSNRRRDVMVCTRCFKYDRDCLCVNKSQFVPVIFEPPSINKRLSNKRLKRIIPGRINAHYCKKFVHFRRGWTEFFRLLGHYAAWHGLKSTFRDYLPVPYSRVLTLEITSRRLTTQKTVKFRNTRLNLHLLYVSVTGWLVPDVSKQQHNQNNIHNFTKSRKIENIFKVLVPSVFVRHQTSDIMWQCHGRVSSTWFPTSHMFFFLPDLDLYLCVLCCFILLCHGAILCVTVFFCVIVLFVAIYSSVFFFLLCMYCFVSDSIYCTLTLPPVVIPIAVNKHLTHHAVFVWEWSLLSCGDSCREEAIIAHITHHTPVLARKAQEGMQKTKTILGRPSKFFIAVTNRMVAKVRVSIAALCKITARHWLPIQRSQSSVKVKGTVASVHVM